MSKLQLMFDVYVDSETQVRLKKALRCCVPSCHFLSGPLFLSHKSSNLTLSTCNAPSELPRLQGSRRLTLRGKKVAMRTFRNLIFASLECSKICTARSRIFGLRGDALVEPCCESIVGHVLELAASLFAANQRGKPSDLGNNRGAAGVTL